MKFSSRLNYFQNRALFRAHFASAREERSYTAYEDLSGEAHQFLQGLNKRLRLLEAHYAPIIEAKDQALERRVADPDDWLTDFNLELWITFRLSESDHECEDDDDNILMQIHLSCRDYGEPRRERAFGNPEMSHAESLPCFDGENHCYLFHELYDHCYLDWLDILRIGRIDVELEAPEQTALIPELVEFHGKSLRDLER